MDICKTRTWAYLALYFQNQKEGKIKLSLLYKIRKCGDVIYNNLFDNEE